MLRKTLSILLAVLLGTVCSNAQQTTPAGDHARGEILALGEGRLVELRLTDRSKLRGWLGKTTNSTFEFRLGEQRLESRTINFDQVRSVKPVKSLKPSHTGRNILIGAGIAVAAIGIGIILAAKSTGYI